ncbi:MAG: phosphatase [Pirellulaceae bacterium]|nr:MAG: phosphatase [Pirellulaceae bacterium]
MMPEPTPLRWPVPIRAVALDMDGLMVNTEDLYSIVGQTLLQRRGKQFTAELKTRMMGLPGPEAYGEMIRYSGITATAEQLADEADQIFARLLEERLEPMPGLEQFLALLEALQLPKAVATSSSRVFAENVLQGIAVADRLRFILTAEDVARGKPHPDIYVEAARRFGVTPPELLVLEDSYNGTQAAVQAGTLTVAVPSRHSRNHDFSQVHFVAQSLADPQLHFLVKHWSQATA